MAGFCHGQGADHCCHLGPFGVCRFLEEHDNRRRRWVCGLRRELGSWRQVHADSRYLSSVRPLLNELSVADDCGDWPPSGVTCATCGVSGG